jgi:4-amino-4-deoxy-L-arabinose transferase-like glycosyltransferase
MNVLAGSARGPNWLGLWLPLLLAAAVYLPATGRYAVIDYDEGHYSQAALQMAKTGDWVTPYDNGVRFLEKPPLMYWITAISLRMFGVTEFALRLPSALGVLALVGIVLAMARRTSGDRAACIAGMGTVMSVGTFLFTREALHDIWLVLFLALAMFAFLEWYRNSQRPLRPALLFYAAVAGAMMTKSLVGIVFPVGIAVLFFLFAREWPNWRTLHLFPGISLFLVLTVPWHWLAAVRNDGFLWSFFVNEQFLRFLGRHDPPVVWSVPLLTFWALNLIWFFPWTAFLPAACANLRRNGSPGSRALVVLSLAWATVILGFFSVSGRLEHYVFPALPALALLVAVALTKEGESAWVRRGFRALAILGALVLIAGIAAGLWLLVTGYAPRGPSAARTEVVAETDFSIMAEMPASIQRSLLVPAGIAIFTLAFGFGTALWFESRGRRLPAVLCLSASMMMICGLAQWSLVLCEDLISSRKFGIAVAQQARSGDHLVVVGDYESANSISFYQPLHIEVFDGQAYSLIPGMKYPDAPRIVLTKEEMNGLWQSESRVFMVAPKARLGEFQPRGKELLQNLDRVLVSNH